MITRRQGLALIVVGAGVSLVGCGGGGGGGAVPGAAQGTVLDVARRQGLSRFVHAVEAAGLAETLSGPGPFTVFAPNNRGFAAADLPSGPEALGRVLRYHVVPGMFTSAFLEGVDVNYANLAGSSLEVDGTEPVLRVNGVPVLTPDLVAENGVVHVIGAVLARR